LDDKSNEEKEEITKNMFFNSDLTIEYIKPDGLWLLIKIHGRDLKIERWTQIKNW